MYTIYLPHLKQHPGRCKVPVHTCMLFLWVTCATDPMPVSYSQLRDRLL